MSKRSGGILMMPAVYFGLIVVAASLVALDLISEIPVWSLPVFAALAVICAVAIAPIRLLDVCAMFVLVILIFPLGVLYLVGSAVNLATPETISIIVNDAGALGWIMILSPLGSAAITYVATARIIRTRVSRSSPIKMDT